jgi:3-methyladenine DNA glycosylase AlkD
MSTTDVGDALVAAVRQVLAEHSDPARAPRMRAYMKSALPYRGVGLPQLRKLARSVYDAHPLPDRIAWEAAVRALWDAAAYREEWYAAIVLTGHRRYAGYQDPGALPLYEHLVVTGAWWDVVDEVATHRVGPLLRDHPDEIAPVLRRWAGDADHWRRRTAILAQVGAKGATDTGLLADCLAPSLGERAFFLRKAIGWALREYAKHDPDWVREYVDAHRAGLAPLSVREATKHL